MKNTLKYYLPVCALAMMLAAIPQEYMPHMDAFLYTLGHADLLADNDTQVVSLAADGTDASANIQTDDDEYVNFAIAQVTDYVNVRSLPSTDGDIVGKLPNGSVAQIQAIAGEANDWFQITSGNVTGYIKAEYFLSGEEAASVLDEYVTTYAQILVDRLNVRKEASTTAERMGYLEKDEIVHVHAPDCS